MIKDETCPALHSALCRCYGSREAKCAERRLLEIPRRCSEQVCRPPFFIGIGKVIASDSLV
jgi:hypothetical protein